MPVQPGDFKAPFLTQQQICEEADNFRAKFWSPGQLPVDVMSIIEFDLKLEIKPISKLRQDVDVDALLLSDWRTLVVDQGHYMDDRYQNRIRFSVAHELGHYVLHEAVFQQVPRASADEWVAFMRDMPEKEYSYLEYHANEFAGRFLVPPNELRQEFDTVIFTAEQNGIPRSQLRDDALLGYLVNPIARCFQVSSDVIERRLTKEQLWPLV